MQLSIQTICFSNIVHKRIGQHVIEMLGEISGQDMKLQQHIKEKTKQPRA